MLLLILLLLLLLLLLLFFFFVGCSFFFIHVLGFGGHSVGVIPGLVSIPVVKSVRVLFVYYGDFYGNFILLPNPFIITKIIYVISCFMKLFICLIIICLYLL